MNRQADVPNVYITRQARPELGCFDRRWLISRSHTYTSVNAPTLTHPSGV